MIYNQISLEDAKFAINKRFIAVNGDGANLITEPNINALNVGPLTFLVPEAVNILTAPTMFDKFVGENAVVKEGVFGQDTVTIKLAERTGIPQPYVTGNNSNTGSNYADVNYSAMSVGVAYRELAWKADYKEIASGGLMNFDIMADKVKAVLNALRIDRNKICFEGLEQTKGSLPVYGLLNFPGLTDYVDVPAGASGDKSWSSKTSEEIANDITFMVNTLNQQSNGLASEAFTNGQVYRVGVSMDVYGYLTKINQYGLLVSDAIKKAFDGRLEIYGIPEMNGYANHTKNKLNGENMAMILIDAGDGIPTAKGSYIELSRFFPINYNGHSMQQVITSAITGCIVNRPVFVARFKGL